MASKDDTSTTTGTANPPRPSPPRVEDASALRDALQEASLRVKRIAKNETESESAGEAILHFRLRSD